MRGGAAERAELPAANILVTCTGTASKVVPDNPGCGADIPGLRKPEPAQK